MKKKLLIIIGLIVVAFICGFMGISNGLSEGTNVTLHGIDLTDVTDGKYTGSYSFKRWSNTVEITIQDHKITYIGIVNDVFAAFITNCSDKLFSRVIEKQNTTVDAVSGATVTSKAYLKAIENTFE
jgi:uncharacterized protein with FMN-binding domain